MSAIRHDKNETPYCSHGAKCSANFSAAGVEPARSCLQWISSASHHPLGKTEWLQLVDPAGTMFTHSVHAWAIIGTDPREGLKVQEPDMAHVV
jgi:hypothetical protein